MRTSTAYFAGAGTVAAAIIVGLGGGLLFSNIVSPHEPKTEMSKLELRMSSKPIPASNAPMEPVPYVDASRVVPAANAAQPQAQPQPQSPPAAPAETVAANPPPPSDAAPAVQAAQAAAPSPPAAAAPAQAAPPEQARTESVKAPEPALAKASDADARREARRAEDRRSRAERRQRWAERRRHQPRQDLELREVERTVRDETEPRQAFTAEPARLEMPRIRLFDPE